MAGGRRIHILAGPNGAGKTTLARELLPNEAACPAFINADLIAAGLSPFDPAKVAVRAGRIMLELIKDHLRRGESFAIETTLSDKAYARAIPTWRSAGYFVALHFLSLPSADAAVARVASRVQQGGHAIPEDVIRRRFAAGITNFHHVYKPLVDSWTLYDSSRPQPLVLAHGTLMTPPTPAPTEEIDLTNPEIAGPLAALRRARLRAEELAARTGTKLVEVVDGEVVFVDPPGTAGRR